MNFNGYDFAPQDVAKKKHLFPSNPGLDYMRRQGAQTYVTENYVCTPPALLITDTMGAVWALGMDRVLSRGEFAFPVLRDALPVGEYANRIEMRAGKISIFGPEGRKAWNGRSFI